jgi:ribose 5-phosphate isomerase B
MNIAVGSDHAAFGLKQKVVERLRAMGHQVEDLGTNSTAACDYPPIARDVAERVAGGKAERGVLMCGTGIGMSIAANKVPGVRAALVYSEKVAAGTRDHNDSNVLVLAGREFEDEANLRMMEVWMGTPYSGEERHRRRLKQIEDIEKRGGSR